MWSRRQICDFRSDRVIVIKELTLSYENSHNIFTKDILMILLDKRQDDID